MRVAARESSRERARALYPNVEGKNAQQMLAYREMQDEDLFSIQWVSVNLEPTELPGYKSPRIVCDVCGEGINFGREVLSEELIDGSLNPRTLCQSCSSPELRYYQPLERLH